MSAELWLTITAVFVTVALLTGLLMAFVLEQYAPGRRRLRVQHALGQEGQD